MNNIKYILSLLIIPIIGFGQNEIFNRQEIIEDLSFLQSELIKNHPNIEIYTSSIEFNDFFANIELPDSLTEIEAYSIITSSNQVIQDGHTLFYPSQNLIEYNNEFGMFLPLKPFWDGNKLFVCENYSNLNLLDEGTEILSINGISSADLIQEMLSRMMRDGGNFNYPIWVLNNYLFEYYSYFYGCSHEYELKLKNDLEEKTIIIQGISKPDLFQQINKHKLINEEGISLQIDEQENTAILTIKDWHNSVLRKYYKQRFIREIKMVIQQIEDRNIENLIIDVRNNQGGDTRNSKYLLSYLLDEPFVLVENYRKKRDGKVVNCNGPQRGIHKPMLNTFSGNVYVLINGGSFSNTGIFCSVLRKHNRATFIGEETGGSEFMICAITKSIKLPNSGITVELPRLQFQIKDYEIEEMHGVIPDFEIQQTMESILKEEDLAMEYSLELIRKKHSTQ